MKTSCIIRLWLLLVIIPWKVLSQEITGSIEQQLETLTEQQGAIENDEYLLQLSSFRKSPLDLNTADRPELIALNLLSELQLYNFLAYRQLLGKIVDIYELQAIPGWDIATIRRLLPFITVSPVFSIKEQAEKRLQHGKHELLFRLSQRFGKTSDSSASIKYNGSAQHIFFRYRYNYKNILQYGMVGEKDAGEQFFKGAQKAGFDFYSFHFFSRNNGIVQTVALGDFTVSLGQGLVHWQGLAVGKSAEVTAIKKQAQVLRPYNSAGEFNFHRGAGVTLAKGKWQTSLFGSLRRAGASIEYDAQQHAVTFSSFQVSGYHRTPTELRNRNKVEQLALGGNIAYTSPHFHIGINSIVHRFSIPMKKNEEAYNLFAISGRAWINAGVDYSYTFRNIHFFGEAAIDRYFHRAAIHGLLVSMDAKLDVSLICRQIEKEYQAVSAMAFTENTSPSNEKGIYTGILLRPSAALKIDMYADIFIFPWIKYRIDAPSSGKDFLIQVSYTPDRKTELYSRYRNTSKQSSQSGNAVILSPGIFLSRQSWRLHTAYKISSSVTVRNRVELTWYGEKTRRKKEGYQTGFLTYTDIIYKPMMKSLSGILRLQYFESDAYESGIYAYENDVLYSYSVPVFFNTGYRFYVIVNFDLNQKLSCWIKLSQTINAGITVSDYASDEQKPEFKLQLRYML